MELNWRSRNDPTHLWPFDLSQRNQNHPVEKETFQWMLLVQLALSMQHTMEQNTPSSSSRQECSLLVWPHTMPPRRQSSLSIKFTTLFVIQHAIYKQLTLYKHQTVLTSLLTMSTSGLLSSYLPACWFFQLSILASIPLEHTDQIV